MEPGGGREREAHTADGGEDDAHPTHDTPMPYAMSVTDVPLSLRQAVLACATYSGCTW